MHVIKLRPAGMVLWAIGVITTPGALAADTARPSPVAAQVIITRDDWGIAHIRAHSDAQAVFGMIYAQAEDDFNRIEMNYLTALGRMAEVDGEAALMQDLRARLYVDPSDLRDRYATCPAWLKALMESWADGLNTYLATHPKVTPKVLRRFEPWMALAFSEGSIGGDIERISLADLASFYGATKFSRLYDPLQPDKLAPTGSNGIAIAPANTVKHHALLLINPHTSFYFRSELQVTSDEGLNAYGAATWGQFFIYQGFNDRLGWMHTSSTSDAVDEFAETIVRQDGALFTRYGDARRPVTTSKVTLSYRAHDGGLASKTYTVFKTQHGPVVGKTADGRWISEAMMFKPVEALEQSYGLTKARDYRSYMEVMKLQANTSNNTVYADADGNIAYLHPQFIPRRDDRFDYTHPVDGADPHTDWHGLHALEEVPHVFDPSTGWIQNTNDWPYSASGRASPRREDFPRYMDTEGENLRGLHAVSLLQGKTGFSLESLVAAAYDRSLPGFDMLIPHLLAAYDHSAADDPLRSRLADQVAMLRAWDRRWSVDSIPTSLAVYWGEALWREAGLVPRGNVAAYDAILAGTTSAQKLHALASASDRIAQDFGTWRTAWGQINRFQRLTDDVMPSMSDAAPSLPVGFTSAQWGSLASISGSQPDAAQSGALNSAAPKRRYGASGNSFVAAVEFGEPVRAVAITAGGESGDPASPHFNDQALRYTTGALREVYFTPSQLSGHIARRYHPGDP